jgi:hypothetical protein
MQESTFEGLGWKVKLQQKRQQFLLTLAKEVALGSGLKRGDDIYYYLVNCENRKGILLFLDGNERIKDDFVRLRGVSFLVKK